MWGDEFVSISKNNENTCNISWVGIGEGGSIDREGSKEVPPSFFTQMINYLYSIDYPDQEDSEANCEWEILCEDDSKNVIDGVEFGCWDLDIMEKILMDLGKITGDDEPFLGLSEIINA